MEFRVFRRSRWCPPRNAGRTTGKHEVWGDLQITVDKWVTIRYVPWVGWLLVAIREGGPNGAAIRRYDHWEYKQMRKPTASAADDANPPQHLAAMESQVLSKLHPLVRQCACTRYDDGTPRLTGSLFICTQGSMWKATVTEPSAMLKLTILAGTLDDALAGLSLALESESVPWEVDQYARSRAPKKKS